MSARQHIAIFDCPYMFGDFYPRYGVDHRTFRTEWADTGNHALRIRHHDFNGHAAFRGYDGESEYRGIQDLSRRGLAEVELHGSTHMHPDHAAWAQAPDRYENTAWFRVLGPTAEGFLAELPARKHPHNRAVAAFRLDQKPARPLHLRVRIPHHPRTVSVRLPDRTEELPVEWDTDGSESLVIE
ncbi:MAG: hypothetical protein FJW20_01555 [Acidimicrobiia bacterium]|nr:hypothetical protein [Acidimicrobiia bacterium]